MAYFFITEDNKIFSGGFNQNGNTGTNITSTNSTYNYSLYPPREIEYHASDGTILDGTMVKDIACGRGGSLLLTTKGEVYVTGIDYVAGQGNASKPFSVFTKIELDGNGNRIPKIDKVFIGSNNSFLLTSNGIVYSTGFNDGNGDSISKKFNIIKTDDKGEPLLPIIDISTQNGCTMLLTNTGEVYGFGASNSNGIYDDDIFTSHSVYYPRKLRVRNIVKIVANQFGFLCLDRFGQLWVNGKISVFGYNPFKGKYYENNNNSPYINLMKLNNNEIYIKDSTGLTKYPFPKKILDIFCINSYPLIKYLDEEDKINIIATNGAQKYIGCGSTSTSYWYNVKGLSGFCEFESKYTDTIYNFDDNGSACMSKDGKLYVAGGKGTVGTTTDKYTSTIELSGTEGLTITRIFGFRKMLSTFNFKDELYPMPDVSKAKVKMQTMI